MREAAARGWRVAAPHDNLWLLRPDRGRAAARMYKFVLLASLVFLPGIAFSQLSSLPPPSSQDGEPVQAIGVNAGASHWENPSTLGAYRFAADGTLDRPNMSAPDNALGLSWSASIPSAFLSQWNSINLAGGTVRMIFAGESASWRNDFGFTFDGIPQGSQSFTAFKAISALEPDQTIHFGDHVDIALAPGEAQHFDFWLNAAGPPGGVYTVLHPQTSTPYVAPGNVLWSQSSILVNTWLPSDNAYKDVPTYLVGMEDWRLDQGSDRDSNDFLFALQIYEARGVPFGPEADVTPVPEPSTYSAAALALVGLTAWRRRKNAITYVARQSPSVL